MKSTLGKKRPIQHRVDDDGLDIFRSSLPRSKAFSMVFSPEAKDYGIDGQLQVFIDEKHAGEFLKVQIKSKDEGKYTDKGKTLSLSLDLNSAFFLVEEVQDPTALIVVDNDSKRVFWYPIQTSPEAKLAVDQQLNRDDEVDNPSITLHIDVESNQLTPDNYQRFHEYFKEAKLKLSKKSMLRLKTDQTFSAGIQHLNDVEKEMLQLPGFESKFRRGPLLTPGTVFSLENSNGKQIDFVPSKDYKPELAPIVKLTAKFSTKSKEEQEKYEAFRQAVQEGIGSIELDSSNIEGFEVSVGSQLLDKKISDDKVQINIGPSKTRQIINLSNGTEELEHPVEIWVEDGNFIISSLPGQALSLRVNFVPGNLNGKFNIGVNTQLMSSVSQQLRLLDFIRNTKQLVISFIDPEGFKRKLFGAELDASALVTDDQYNFAKALSDIEQKSGVPIPFPLPDDTKMKDIQNVFWVHKILTEGKVTQDITLNFSLQKEPSEELEEGKYMVVTHSPPEIYLFNRPYIMPNLKQTISGKIDELDMPKGDSQPTYKVRIKEAEISLEKATL